VDLAAGAGAYTLYVRRVRAPAGAVGTPGEVRRRGLGSTLPQVRPEYSAVPVSRSESAVDTGPVGPVPEPVG